MGIAMPIAFSCSGCKKKYEVGDQLAGKMGRCKQCGNQFRIPVPRTLAAPPAPKAPPTSDLLDDFDEEDTFPEDDDLMGAEPEEDAAASFGPRASAETPKKKQKKKKSSRAGATGGLANLPLPQMILGGGGTLLVLFLMLVVVPSMRNVENEADAAADPAGQVGEANPAVHVPAPAVADAAPPANAPGAVPNPVAEGPGPGQAPIPVPPASPLRDRARFQPRMPNRGGNPRLASAGFSPDDEPPPPNADPITLALFQLKSSRTSTVKRGLDALSRMAPDESRKAEVASAIVPLVVSDEGWTAESAVKAIASWPTPEGIQALINAVERDDRFNVRRVAIEKLAALKETSAATAIAGRLRTDGFQATAALRALGPEAEPAVLPLLSSPDASERRNACQILKEIGGQATLDTMKGLPADTDTSVRFAAADTMKTISARLALNAPRSGRFAEVRSENCRATHHPGSRAGLVGYALLDPPCEADIAGYLRLSQLLEKHHLRGLRFLPPDAWNMADRSGKRQVNASA